MLPVARTALRRIGNDADVVTFISQYTRNRFASAFGPGAALERLSPGVDVDRFEPNSVARAQMRARYGLGDRPVVVCVSRLVPRKGQDMLIRALPALRERVPGTRLVIVGGGPYLDDLRRLAHSFGVAEDVVFTEGVPAEELPAHHAMADVFAMPCRTRGAGLDVEGLGIVYLEASAMGVPVVAGDSGERRSRCSTARPVWWSTGGTSGRSPPPSETCWPTPAAPPRWAGRAETGSSTNGSGAPRRNGSRNYSPVRPPAWRRGPRFRPRTSPRPPCA